MKKEQHIYKIQDEDKGIVYVFNVTRREKSISLESIWLVVIHNQLETKLVLDIPGIVNEILLSPEQAAEPSATNIIKQWFGDMKLAQDEIIAADFELEPDIEFVEVIDDVEGHTDHDDIVKDLLNGIPKKYH